jgi:hypothetical protein
MVAWRLALKQLLYRAACLYLLDKLLQNFGHAQKSGLTGGSKWNQRPCE